MRSAQLRNSLEKIRLLSGENEALKHHTESLLQERININEIATQRHREAVAAREEANAAKRDLQFAREEIDRLAGMLRDQRVIVGAVNLVLARISGETVA